MTMCGYCCDLCKAFAQNIKTNDKREGLASAWKKYYNLDFKAEDTYCDGCRCEKADAKRIDIGCPVRKCVLEKRLNHCGDCNDYPCNIFDQRKGLCAEEAECQQGEEFNIDEYNEYLLAYDNKVRLDKYIQKKHSK